MKKKNKTHSTCIVVSSKCYKLAMAHIKKYDRFIFHCVVNRHAYPKSQVFYTINLYSDRKNVLDDLYEEIDMRHSNLQHFR